MNSEEAYYDVICVGGGLSGLTAAIHLSKKGYKILVLEKSQFPKHKVCGEYVSNEVLPYLKSLGFNPFEHGAQNISEFELTTVNNKTITTKLPLGGFGLSRYTMDYELMVLAKKLGAKVEKNTVVEINFIEEEFTIVTKSKFKYKCKCVIGAFGKRSNIDVSLKRKFIQKHSPYLAVKLHMKGGFNKDKVALHNFQGGYCGVSKVEDDIINVCYISSYKRFKTYKNLEQFKEVILFKNEALKELIQNSKPQFEKPLTISQISFEIKTPVEDHIIMCGDSAGMIHPLCGNGMAMAIRSAKIASEHIIEYLEGRMTRLVMEERYKNAWEKTFRLRLKTGRIIDYLFRQSWLTPPVLFLLRTWPTALIKLIKLTHGKPMKAV